jgi:hypothetical protein
MGMLKAIRLRAFVSVLLACGLSLASSATVGAANSTRSTHRPKARAAASLLVGVADEHTEMFSDRLWQQLHTKVTRYIVPYDAVAHPSTLAQATAWIHAAEGQHQQILVAFYHSEYSPTRMPSVGVYTNLTRKFIKRFPRVHQYQPWNEANRGNIRYKGESFNSPTAAAAAKYYQALRRVCLGCTVLGLDILDQPEVASSLAYLAEFKAEIRHLGVPMPTFWGLHNYSDTNRFSSSRTRAVIAAVPGEVWLTETGGVVQFGGAFPNYRGSGLSRAAKALSYMFGLAWSNSRVKRLYIYQWSGSTHAAIFDAGLTDYRHRPRLGYVVVCAHAHAAKCKVKVSAH